MKRRTQGKNGVAGLKIDISKAYDELEWSYIKNIMRRYEINEIWVNRIMSFIQSVSYSFLHNGSEFGCVIPQRGLCQGDPISPYIYIMCAEGISAIVHRNEEAGLLHGVAIARGAPTISHFLFADDCYFFFKANKAEAGVIKRIVTRVEQKLQVWGNQTLSKAGKITLLKTAKHSIPNFWMNLLLIPGEVFEKIERSMNTFWWGNGGTGRGIKWMARERMCTIKEDGGLWIKSLKSFNITMLAKQGWRLLNNVNPLVTSMIKAKYFPDSDFLDAKSGVNPSYMWRSIMEAQNAIK
ncbi:uncharacterized protein LOC141719725 [Apium graveolens]|uniref:uncharacterized protein LOC141719725 n=1 Tax=Apium graveolens TaxID=4045 RepID=UPI003D7C103D